MKLSIYTFHCDTQYEQDTQVFTSAAALADDIHSAVEEFDPDRLEEFTAHPFESENWLRAWFSWKEFQAEQNNYFSYGSQEIDIPPAAPISNAPEKGSERESYEIMTVASISTAHITKEDGAQLLKADARDVLFTLFDGTGHIVHSLDDEDINEAFPPDRFSDAFRAMFQYFRDRDFEYVRIDANGPTIPDLPTFAW